VIGVVYLFNSVVLMTLLLRMVLQSMADAIDYFKRKVDFLGQQIEKVQQVGRDKSSIRSGKWINLVRLLWGFL